MALVQTFCRKKNRFLSRPGCYRVPSESRVVVTVYSADTQGATSLSLEENLALG